MGVYTRALHMCTHAHPMAEFDRSVREDLTRMWISSQPRTRSCHGVSAVHEPPCPHQAAGGTFEEGMVLRGRARVLGRGARPPCGGNFLVTASRARKATPPSRTGSCVLTDTGQGL